MLGGPQSSQNALVVSASPGTTWRQALLGKSTSNQLPSKLAEFIDSFEQRAAIKSIGLGSEGREPGNLLRFQARSVKHLTPPRSIEVAWRRTHVDELRALAGQWVIVEGNELIAHGPDPSDLVAAAKARGIQVPYVFFVEPLADGTIKLGI